ncbi:MAG: hypothetical protein HY925_12345, partial [Elusimicrobia bacterium]|nr:hypothetical protein [Elusimicrobiota bacterium]
ASFDYREEPVSGDKDLWYRFYDDKGAAVSVSARTGEARVDAALPPKRDGGGSVWKRALGGLGLAALTAAVYGGLYYAASHAPAAVSSIPTAPGGWEMLFGGTLGGLGLGLRARLAEAFRKAKPALITLGLIAATAGMYAAMAYAFMHAPAASSGIQVPEGWQGPIPSNIDIGAIFGGTLGLAGLSGVIKRVKGKAPKITDERVRAAANSAIASKGRPWSQTEYNMSYYMALESLKKDGATAAQIALFEKLCADAPIRGGSFNPWSGD